MEIQVIAYARNGHSDKFGIPRQSSEASPIRTRIVFEPAYRVAEALRGIEGYSHLWLLWGFSEVESVNWSPTVRPPRLGGNKRMGVFATRSPFRPNPIGLSSVRLEGIEKGELIVSGADLKDGTPIYDIKPYLPFSDAHPDALEGFAAETKGYCLAVKGEEAIADEEVREAVRYILSQDPRPGYQRDPERVYKMEYGGYKIGFRVQEGTAEVVSVVPKNDKRKCKNR